MKVLHRQLKDKSIKSRQGCFGLLSELAHTVPGALEEHIPALVPGTSTLKTQESSDMFFQRKPSFSLFFLSLLCPPGILFSLTDKSASSNMKIDALCFLHVLLISHPPQAFQPHMQVLQASATLSAFKCFFNLYIMQLGNSGISAFVVPVKQNRNVNEEVQTL